MEEEEGGETMTTTAMTRRWWEGGGRRRRRRRRRGAPAGGTGRRPSHRRKSHTRSSRSDTRYRCSTAAVRGRGERRGGKRALSRLTTEARLARAVLAGARVRAEARLWPDGVVGPGRRGKLLSSDHASPRSLCLGAPSSSSGHAYLGEVVCGVGRLLLLLLLLPPFPAATSTATSPPRRLPPATDCGLPGSSPLGPRPPGGVVAGLLDEVWPPPPSRGYVQKRTTTIFVAACHDAHVPGCHERPAALARAGRLRRDANGCGGNRRNLWPPPLSQEIGGTSSRRRWRTPARLR